MHNLTFKKGIHPDYHKMATQNKAIEVLMPLDELVFPMSQHIGVPATPIVKKGDRVLVGQKIGEANGFVSVPVHSSVSGTVKVVEERMTFRGTKDMCVVITQDGKYEAYEEMAQKACSDYENLTKVKFIELIKDSGIVGMGGATFPAHVKLSVPEDKKVAFIVINGAECEPYLTSDYRVMLEFSKEIIGGLKVLLSVFKDAKVIIGIEDNKPDAIAKLQNLVRDVPRMAVVVLHTKYPQGSEKHLIYATTRREVPNGKLPIDIGCIVHNIDSIVAIYRAIVKGCPIMSRIVTVSGSGIKNPCNLEVKIGDSFRHVLEKAGWDATRTQKVIAGGPMMGIAISDIDVPIVKGTSAILCFTEEELKPVDSTACIRCGKCVEVCPMSLVPNILHRSAMHNKYEVFLTHNGMNCIECGCCAFNCPAKRDIVQSIRTAKAAIHAKK